LKSRQMFCFAQKIESGTENEKSTEED